MTEQDPVQTSPAVADVPATPATPDPFAASQSSSTVAGPDQPAPPTPGSPVGAASPVPDVPATSAGPIPGTTTSGGGLGSMAEHQALRNQADALAGAPAPPQIDVRALVDQLSALGIDLGQLQSTQTDQLQKVRDEAAAKMDKCDQCGKPDGLRVHALPNGDVEYRCEHDGHVQPLPRPSQ